MLIIDWIVVAIIFLAVLYAAYTTRKYTRSVADFLVAGRCAKRYLMTLGAGAVGVGAMVVMSWFQMYYKGGFSLVWFGSLTAPIAFIFLIYGWVVVRYRETRVLTPAQLFEVRYNRSFRKTMGIVGFLGGIMAAGIIPGVAARFFIAFCGLPDQIPVLGLSLPMMPVVMFVLLGVGMLFVFWGGQIGVLVTDVIQKMFLSIVFISIAFLFVYKLNWTAAVEVFESDPAGYSVVNPFDSMKIKGFNVWFAVLGLFIYSFYNRTCNANTQSTKNAHEARMGNILTFWAEIGSWSFYVLVPMSAYVMMRHEYYSPIADSVQGLLAGFDNKAVQSQLTVPMVIRSVLPAGTLGFFAAAMLAAFISTVDSTLHRIGTSFIQDAVMPFRKTPFSPKTHLWMLKGSMVALAIFMFIFSLFYNHVQDLVLFLSGIGAIFSSSWGASIIGGLYWKKGTTAGAFAGLICGSISGLVFFVLAQTVENFAIGGLWPYFISAMCAITGYITLSLLTCKKNFNMDKLLHRGKYAIEEEKIQVRHHKQNWLYKKLNIGDEFTRTDKVILFGAQIWPIVFAIGSITMAICYFTLDLSREAWVKFWYGFMAVQLVFGLATTIWFTIGGCSNLRSLYKDLKTAKRNDLDDGWVEGHHNREDEQMLETIGDQTD